MHERLKLGPFSSSLHLVTRLISALPKMGQQSKCIGRLMKLISLGLEKGRVTAVMLGQYCHPPDKILLGHVTCYFIWVMQQLSAFLSDQSHGTYMYSIG